MTRYTPLWLQSGSYAASVDRRLVGALYPAARVDGMAVSVATGTTVNVGAGNAVVPTPNNTGSTLCVSDAVEQVALPPAPAAGLNRIDLVIVRPRGTDLDGGVNNDFIYDYVTGAEAASAVAPATPAGTVALANVTRPGGSAAVVAGNIADVRPSSLAIPTADPSLPKGWIASATWGGITPIQATYAKMWAGLQGVPVEAGRHYLVGFEFQLSQVTAASTTTLVELRTYGTLFGGGEWKKRVLDGARTTGNHYSGGALDMAPTASGTVNIELWASTTPGELRNYVNELTVMDVGT